jgi:hypothetical protein
VVSIAVPTTLVHQLLIRVVYFPKPVAPAAIPVAFIT